jgi:hypothetical protein
MTVKELREKLTAYNDDEEVFVIIEQVYNTNEMNDVYPGWSNQCVLEFPAAVKE